MMMRRTGREKIAFKLLAPTLVALLVISSPAALAHGGEDHGEKKAEAVSAGANMTARVVRVGDYEVTIKHPNVEPDTESMARVFVTRFGTNEPVGDAKIVVIEQDASGVPVEVAATATSTPGIYEVKLPPMRQGECSLSARVEIGGKTMVADYGAMMVSMPQATTSSGVALWARTVLIVFALLITLGLLVLGAVYFVLPHFRRNRARGETLPA